MLLGLSNSLPVTPPSHVRPVTRRPDEREGVHESKSIDSSRLQIVDEFTISRDALRLREAEDESAKTSHLELSNEEKKEVEELKERDREVRAHERAHKSILGAYGGSIHYDFTRGPDHQNYAVGGNVPVDMSEIPGNPEATAAKMRVIARAASAPADPSSQDNQVRARASQKEQEARADLASEDAENAEGEEESNFRLNQNTSVGLRLPQNRLAAYRDSLAPLQRSQYDRVA